MVYGVSTLASVWHHFYAFIVENRFLKTLLVLKGAACLIKKKALRPTAESSHSVGFIHI